MQFRKGQRVLTNDTPRYYARIVGPADTASVERQQSECPGKVTPAEAKRRLRRWFSDRFVKRTVRGEDLRFEVVFEFDGHAGTVDARDIVAVPEGHHLPASEIFTWWNARVNWLRRAYGRLRVLPWLAVLPFVSVWPYLLPPGVHRGNHNSTLLSVASGNFTSASTWALCDATAESDSEATATNLSSSNQDSNAFAPGAITVSAVALKYRGQNASTGTVTVTLRNSTAGSDVASVTINAADLPSIAGGIAGGWIVFKFAAPQLLLAATNYVIRATATTTGGAQIYSTTGTNWSRQLITSTTQAPAANDKLIVAGDYTGAGTGNSYTVTHDNTATTTFGPTAAGAFGLSVSGKGSLVWGTAAATNYYLKLAGRLGVYRTGTWTKGASGATIPTSSTMTLEMVPNSNVDTGIELNANAAFNDYGPSIAVLQTKLAADAAAGATSLTTVATTNWPSGASVTLAATTRTPSECEKKSLSGPASGTTLPVAALTNAHSGTTDANGDIRAEVGLLTRYSVIKGTSAALNTYMNAVSNAVVNIQYCELENFGSNVAGKRGVDVATTGGTFNMQYCSLHDFTTANARGVNISSASGSSITWSNNVTYNIANQHFTNVSTSGVQVVDGNLCIRNTDTSSISVMVFSDQGSTYTNNTAVGSAGGASHGILWGESGNSPLTGGTFTGNTAHSNFTSGIVIAGNGYGGTIGTLTVWRNAGNNSGAGLNISGQRSNTIIDGLVSFGNASAGLFCNVAGYGLVIVNAVFDGGVTFTQPTGLDAIQSASTPCIVTLENSTFGNTNAHSTGDIRIGGGGSTNNPPVAIVLRNCKLASATEVSGQSVGAPYVSVTSQKHDQTSGSHKAWFREGTVATDAVRYYGASGTSARFTPLLAAEKGRVYVGSVRVPSGATCTASVWVFKSNASVGDVTYNGGQPSLCVQRNVAAGISADTVLASTTSSADGAWQQISGTTGAVTDDCVLHFYVEGAGTAGFFNVDDFSATRSADPSTIGQMNFWDDGQPAQQWETISGGSGSVPNRGVLAGGVL